MGFTFSHTLHAQASFWEQNLISDYYVDDGLDAIGPWTNVTTDRQGNILVAQYVSEVPEEEGDFEVSVQIQKYSSSNELINVASYPVEKQYWQQIKMETDYYGNIYLYTTVSSIPFGDPYNYILIKYNPSLTLQWVAQYPVETDEAIAHDLIIDNNSPGVEIYISGTVLSGWDEYSFIARYSTTGDLVDMSLYPEVTEYKFIQDRDESFYAIGAVDPGGDGSTIYIVHIPEGSPGYTTNVSDATQYIWFDYAYYPGTVDQAGIDRFGNLYILGESYIEGEFSQVLCSLSPEDGFIWSSKPFTDDPLASGWPAEIWEMEIDPFHKRAMYIAGMHAGDLKVIAVDRTNGTLVHTNVIDTLMFAPDFTATAIDHSDHLIENDDVSDYIPGRPLELIVTPDEVYVESFGWFELEFIFETPKYFISRLTKDLERCDVIDDVSITPYPVNFPNEIPDTELYTYSLFMHPYSENSELYYNRLMNQLCFVYTDRSIEEICPGYDDFGSCIATDLRASAYLRYYTEGFRSEQQTAEISERSAMMMYPNPADSYLVITTNQDAVVDYVITDATGRMVLQGAFACNGQIDVQSLAAGTYFVFVSSGEELMEAHSIIIE